MRERGEDIVLLFRKFTTDFSEKYNVKPITLNEEAKTLLMKFAFPGNIRQLKNLAEQISLLEENREVDANTLSRYLPTEQSRLPAAYPRSGSGGGDSGDFSEREILYKVLFDMKKDMNDLKKLVLESFQSGSLNQSLLKKHATLFDDVDSAVSFDEEKSHSPSLPLVLETLTHERDMAQDAQDYEENAIEDVVHEEDDTSLSIEKKEKELILKALKKHNNKRKYAAMDLGISERTLYRKIKQYEISE